MKKSILVVLLSLMSLSAYADKDTRYGIIASYGSYTVDDPEGESQSVGKFNIISGLTLVPLSRKARFWIEGGIIEFDSSATPNNVSQEVEQIYINSIYQKKFRLARNFKPWLGAGLQFEVNEYKGRFLVDNDGFLAASFPDREEEQFSLVLNASLDKEFRRKDFKLTFFSSYTLSIDDGIGAIKTGVGITY